MQRLGEVCLDCGSAVASRVEDNQLPDYRTECISYVCGAKLKISRGNNGTTGRAVHRGCSLIEAQVAPV